ncbi:hypothetical protein JQ561_33930 [Bradyrhizobium diazoefficiens]|nr:hypothetical protein [Bradyrhizobium diazoefficiens]MBR0931637.1 hypothetical protein [Bradyrhizobium diazoefficiens]
MGQVFDEADYRRRLEALETSNIAVGEEAGLLGYDLLSGNMQEKGGNGQGALNARKDILLAKQRALRDARKKMVRAIRAAEDKARQNDLLPTEVEQIVTGQSDTLVKV